MARYRRWPLVRQSRHRNVCLGRLAYLFLMSASLAVHKLQIAGAEPGQRDRRRAAIVFEQTDPAIEEVNQAGVAAEFARVIRPQAHLATREAAGFAQNAW